MEDQIATIFTDAKASADRPKDWKMTTLGEVLERITKGTTPKDFSIDKNDINYIKSESLSYEGVIDELKFVKITSETNNELQRSKLKENDILLSMAGIYLGKTGLVKKKMLPANTNQAVAILTVNSQVDYKFLWFKLRSKDSINYFNSTPSQSAQPNINFEEIKSLPFFLPPIPEQHAIAAVLSSLDDKIELLREQNKTLEATAQAIFKEWFVNFNFPGATGKMIDSELGKIPEGWRVGTVNDVITRHTITYRCDADDLSKTGKTPIIDQGSNGLYGYTEREPDFEANTENPVILFTNHTCNMWFINYPFCAIQNVIPFRGNEEYSSFFVYYMTLGRVTFIEYKGHWPDFEQKEYVIPTPEFANKFAETVKPLQYKIWNNNSQIQTLSTLRDTLLPKLMKGEVRVVGFLN